MNKGNRRKMKVKVNDCEYGVSHCFQICDACGRDTRSCGVVRSIMSPSRGDDPGSNPGTSTNMPPVKQCRTLIAKPI